MKRENNENEGEMIYYVSGTAYITSDAHNSLKPPSLRVKELGLRSNFVPTNVTFWPHRGILWDVSVHIKNTCITIISTLQPFAFTPPWLCLVDISVSLILFL